MGQMTSKALRRNHSDPEAPALASQNKLYVFIPSEATFRKYNFICTLKVQTYAVEMFKKFFGKQTCPMAQIIGEH